MSDTDGMKKYSFQMTQKETIEFTVRMVAEEMGRVWFKWLLLLGICILECILVPGVGLVVVLFLLAVVALYLGRNYALVRGKVYGRPRDMWVEDGMLKLDTEGEHNEISCASVSVIRTTAHLLLLGYCQAPGRIGWYPIPLRIFAHSEEKDGFLEAIRDSGGRVPEEAGGFTDCGKTEEFFHFSFRIERENWIEALSEATEIIRAGTFGKQKKNWLVWVVCTTALAAVQVLLALCFPGAALICMTAAFILSIVALAVAGGFKGHPGRRIRAQIARGNMQNHIYGDWQIWITETGVRQDVPNQGNVVLPWGNLRCLVETDGGLYLFKQDERQFLVIPKTCLEGVGQVQKIKELCREKGMAVMAGKKMRYAPGWLFPLLRVLVIAGYVAAGIWFVMGDV